jgi:hypothetical protein
VCIHDGFAYLIHAALIGVVAKTRKRKLGVRASPAGTIELRVHSYDHDGERHVSIGLKDNSRFFVKDECLVHCSNAGKVIPEVFLTTIPDELVHVIFGAVSEMAER